MYGTVWRASLRGRSPNGKRAKAKRTRQVLQNGANCTGRHQMRTRTGRWRSGRDAGSFVATSISGCACSDCAVWVAAAPLLVSRGGGTRVKMYRLDGHPELKKLDIQGSLLFSKRPKKRALRCPYGVKRPKFAQTGYYESCSQQYCGVVRVGSICYRTVWGLTKKWHTQGSLTLRAIIY